MLRFAVTCRLLHTSQTRQRILKMTSYPDAHFRFKEGCETFDFSFYFENPALKVSRNFNFSRRVTETVGEFQSRVLANLEKTLSKKKKKAKNVQAEDSADALKVIFRVDGENAEASVNCKELLLKSNVTMHVLDTNYRILVNAPVITTIGLPESMLAGFPTYPSKLEIEFADRKDCKFTWYRSTNKAKEDQIKETLPFEEVGTDFSYTPSAEDVGHAIKLKCEPVKGELKGPAIEVVSKGTVSAGPGHCPFHTRHLFTPDYLSGPKFRIMSYNILADFYTDSDYSREVLFPYCPPYALAIDYRKQLLLKEISCYNADLICLQEVDRKVFDADLDPLLSNLGYSGAFSKKSGQVSEGIACFYRKKTFELVLQEFITLSQEITENPLFESIRTAINKNEALKSRILDRGSILHVAILRHIATKHLIIVGSTHLYFHPDADHVRLLQAATCLSYLQHKQKEYLNEASNCSLILCGDFNSTPPFGVYKLMTEGSIPKDYADWKSNESEAVEGLELDHNMKIASACGCPKYTNFTVGFADCLDYIFYQTDHLKVTQVVPLPSDEELQQYTAIPSVVQPSDHVALVADLEITLD